MVDDFQFKKFVGGKVTGEAMAKSFKPEGTKGGKFATARDTNEANDHLKVRNCGSTFFDFRL